MDLSGWVLCILGFAFLIGKRHFDSEVQLLKIYLFIFKK